MNEAFETFHRMQRERQMVSLATGETIEVGNLRASHAEMLAALREIVKNDPFNQSSAGLIAQAAIARAEALTRSKP